MMLKPISLAAAGLAVAAQAFLLPPEISQSDVDTVDSLTAHVGVYTHPQHAIVNVPCPGYLPQGNGRHHGSEAASDASSYLVLAFAVNRESTPNTLEINAIPLYPRANPFLDTLTAAVLPYDAVQPAVKELRRHCPRPVHMEELGYHLSVTQKALNAEDGLALYDLTLQITQVGDDFIEGLPSVHMTLVEAIDTGALAIGEVTMSEAAVSATPEQQDKEAVCTGFMCDWLAQMKDSMAKLKGKPCHGKMRGDAKGPHPHHGGHHHHNKHPSKVQGGSRHHRWGQDRSWRLFFKNLVQHIILPIAVGIVAGVSVSLIGMMFGTLIVTVWRTFFRCPGPRGRASAHSHGKPADAEVAAADVEEKSGLLEYHDAPPSYDEDSIATPPSYEEEAAPKTTA
jgi:hypothetical protein